MKPFLDGYYNLLKRALALLMGLIVLPVSLQILSRYTGVIPRYIWTEEVARFCFVWIIMIGAMIAVRDGSHFDVDLLPRARSRRRQAIRNLVVNFGMGLMALFFAVYGFQFARFGFIQNSEMSGINMATIYASFPLAGLTWLLFLGEKIHRDFRLMKSPDQKVPK